MSEGWKQIWTDIRHALREPGAGEPQHQEIAIEQELTGDENQRSGAAETFPRSLSSSPRRAIRWSGVLVVLAIGFIAVVAFFLLRRSLPGDQSQPPASNIVATYAGGQITIEDLRQHLALLVPDERILRNFQSAEDYRVLVEEMITDALVRRWAAERRVTRDENIQHVMKHITEEINLDKLHSQMHKERMGVTEGDIQAYYEANRQLFGEQTLTAVRDQIRTTLQAQRESQFIKDYINRLKGNATITRNFTLLEVPEPEERELRTYYENNRERYVLPAQVVVDEIQIPIGQDEAAAQEQANKVLAKLRSGAEFPTVAKEFSAIPFAEQGTLVRAGERDPAYDTVVFSLDVGQISDVFRSDNAFYIVRLRKREPERQQTLDEVREQVRQAVLAEKTTAWFQENADRTLFTIRGKRYTVGEFWEEYQELSPTFLAEYQGVERRQVVAERLIERLLLLEDSYDRLLDVSNKGEIEEVRLDVLAQMLHQEEVDDKIEVTDAEVQKYYEDRKAELVEPPQAKIRYIAIRLGQTEDERKRAWEKANEAYEKLVPGLFRTGADFGEVARQYSEDELTANKGGELESWIREGPDLLAELVQHPFHEQVLKLREGEISQPFAWGNALYIVQVRERKEPRQLTFEEAQEFIRETLRMEKHEALAKKLSQQLLDQAKVTIYDQALQAFAKEQSQSGRP